MSHDQMRDDGQDGTDANDDELAVAVAGARVASRAAHATEAALIGVLNVASTTRPVR